MDGGRLFDLDVPNQLLLIARSLSGMHILSKVLVIGFDQISAIVALVHFIP